MGAFRHPEVGVVLLALSLVACGTEPGSEPSPHAGLASDEPSDASAADEPVRSPAGGLLAFDPTVGSWVHEHARPASPVLGERRFVATPEEVPDLGGPAPDCCVHVEDGDSVDVGPVDHGVPQVWDGPVLADDPDSEASDVTESPPVPTCEHAGQGLVGLPSDPASPRFVDISYLAESGPIRGVDTGWGGVAIADFDGDGAPDLVFTSDQGHVGLLGNCGDGTFGSVPGAFPESLRRARGFAVGDVDNDGDPDLWIGAWGRTHLFINQGDGSLADDSAVWGLGVVAGAGGAAFVDFDNDGDLDLYEAFYETGRNHLRRNDGGHFVEVTTTPGNAPRPGSSLVATWTDLDGDGRPDLYLVNDFGPFEAPNRLFLNRGPEPDDPNGWRFEDAGAATGFEVAIFGMGSAYGDIDNDGDLDAYTANVARNVLHVQGVPGEGDCPDNSFGFCVVDEAELRGVGVGQVAAPPAAWPDYDPDSAAPREAALAEFCATYCDREGGAALVSFGVNFFDVDQNGWVDLFVSNGWVLLPDVPTAELEPNELFLNDVGTFTPAPAELFPNTTATSRGSAVGDLDRDGDLDLVWLDNGRMGAGRLTVLENRAATGNWLRVRVNGTVSNRDAIGARVTVVAGGSSQIREVESGQGYSSASERHPHFGLGAVTVVDELSVRWPSGTVQVLTDLAANQWVVLEEPAGE